MIRVTFIPALSDNYAYLLQADNGDTGIVDPGEAAPVIRELERLNLKPGFIFNTHHHGDHIAGNEELKHKYGAKLAAPASEEKRISGIDIGLSEGMTLAFGGEDIQTIETPGHTRGGICLYAPESGLLFTGDTLFSMGCGRLFEGSAEQMWNSLQKIRALPEDTKLFCGHEYTLHNGEFCLKVEPENQALKARVDNVRRLRAQNIPTLPTTLALEKETNAFLRAHSVERFAELRAAKDRS